MKNKFMKQVACIVICVSMLLSYLPFADAFVSAAGGPFVNFEKYGNNSERPDKHHVGDRQADLRRTHRDHNCKGIQHEPFHSPSKGQAHSGSMGRPYDKERYGRTGERLKRQSCAAQDSPQTRKSDHPYG